MKTSLPATTKQSPKIWGTGLVALDIIYNAATPHLRSQFAGGTCGNVLTILSYLGWDAYPIARLNGDAASECIKRDFQKWGLHLDYLSLAPGAPAPIIVQRIAQRGNGQPYHSFSWNCPDCGADLPRYKPIHKTAVCEILPVLENDPPQVFFFDRVSRGALLMAQATARQGGIVMFEPTSVGNPNLFREALECAHILKYAQDRFNSIELDELESPPILEIKTCGDKGLQYRTSSLLQNIRLTQWQNLHAHTSLGFVDSAGAGDWCSAGLLHCLRDSGIKGLEKSVHDGTITTMLNYSQALSAWCCKYEGPRGGMYLSEKSELEEFASSISVNKWENSCPKIYIKTVVSSFDYSCSSCCS